MRTRRVRARLLRRGFRKAEVMSAVTTRASRKSKVGLRAVLISGSNCSGNMLEELGFIGTIGEDDEVPVEPESDSGDEEEVRTDPGSGRSGRQSSFLDCLPSPRFLCPQILSIPEPGWLVSLEEPLTGTPRSFGVCLPLAFLPSASAIAFRLGELCQVTEMVLNPGPVSYRVPEVKPLLVPA